MRKITYEIDRKMPMVYRVLITTETYDENTKSGGIGYDVIFTGSKSACIKKKEELENAKNKKIN